jgi:dienelactone hydrolase
MDAMEQEFRTGKVDYQITYYSGAVHAYTMPGAGNDNSSGAAYNANADRHSWQAMQNFFQEIFAK